MEVKELDWPAEGPPAWWAGHPDEGEDPWPTRPPDCELAPAGRP